MIPVAQEPDMSSAAAREQLRDRILQLTPRKFEVLCKIILADDPRTAGLTVTPASQDGGIDIEGRFNDDWFAADFGVQVKRYSRENLVGNDRVHRLAGALSENGYDLGTLVTTSSYTGPATKAAEQLPIKLVSGTDLATSMLRSGIGVREVGETCEFDATFWQSLTEIDQRVPASEVPLGNNFDKVRDVLRAVRDTDGTADAIAKWLSSAVGDDISERHIYINANSATVLGLARKEPSAGDNDVQRWGLTELGAEYLNAARKSMAARQLLHRAIRSVELVDKIRSRIVDTGELSKVEIDDFIAAETTGLSESSVARRSSALRTWLAFLPEIEVEGPRTSKTYVCVDNSDNQPSLETFRE